MKGRAILKKTAYVFLCLLLSVWMGAGVCVARGEAGLDAFRLSDRMTGGAGTREIAFVPDLAGEYLFFAFSDAPVRAVVSAGENVLAQGGLPLAVRLGDGDEVTVSLSAEGAYVFEIMRNTLGRNALNPIDLTLEAVSRTITRACDVHWFRFVAPEDGEYRFTAVRAVKSGVRAALLLMDEKGNPIGDTRFSEDAAGAFSRLCAGDACLIRVCAPGTATGNYLLTAQRAVPAEEEAVPEALSLSVGQWTHVSVSNGCALWQSDDDSVATVTADGVIAAVGEGTCTVWAYLPGEAANRISVSVERARVQGISFSETKITLPLGGVEYPEYSVTPAYARDAGVRFSSGDEAVVTVTGDGRAIGKALGTTYILAETSEGGFTARVEVEVVKPDPVYRALLVGIASYADGRVRTGCVNTTQGMADALSQPRFDKTNYLTDMRIDLTRDELVQAVDEAFAGAVEGDVSLFYINCHGNTAAGVAYLELQDGTKMSAYALERMLRRVPGYVIVVLDCCFSGAFIGRDARPDAFNHGVVSVFSGASGAGENAFASDKYRVLVSSSMDQSSYRVASSSPVTESGMATVFARAFTEALGWDLVKDKTGSMKADLDDNRQVTLHEAYLYTYRRCMYYLTRSPASAARQSVQAWPMGSAFVIAK